MAQRSVDSAPQRLPVSLLARRPVVVSAFVLFTLGMVGRWTTNQQASYFITVLFAGTSGRPVAEWRS